MQARSRRFFIQFSIIGSFGSTASRASVPRQKIVPQTIRRNDAGRGRSRTRYVLGWTGGRHAPIRVGGFRHYLKRHHVSQGGSVTTACSAAKMALADLCDRQERDLSQRLSASAWELGAARR